MNPLVNNELQIETVEYHKNCYICGKFVKKDRWTRIDHPRCAVPMCRDCASICDDPHDL